MMGSGDRRMVGWWLLALAAMVLVMVDLGGWTRLSGSGLSMVDWQPLNVFPPLDDRAWREWFALYQQSPQYRLVNVGMTLDQFKGIFWLEYVHRLWGRLLGFAFLVPFIWFVATRRIGRGEAPGLFLIFVAGGLEGVLGWVMVSSGLVHDPQVSQIDLAAHLTTALMIFAAMLWVGLGPLRPPGGMMAEPAPARRARRPLLVVLMLVCLTIPAGGLVAGLHAGLIYNTFPLMGGRLVPGEAFGLDPWWRSLFADRATVQLDHRVLAIATWAVSVSAWLRGRRLPLPRASRRLLALVPAVATVQAGLGIATLLLVVPPPLAAAHQLGAFILAGTVIWAVRWLTPVPAPAPARAWRRFHLGGGDGSTPRPRAS